MSVPVRFFSLFLRLDVVGAHYPGGLGQFRTDFPHGVIEAGLIRFVAMSGQDIDDDFRQIEVKGFDAERYATIADMMGGALQSGEGIVLENTAEDSIFPCWVARAA